MNERIKELLRQRQAIDEELKTFGLSPFTFGLPELRAPTIYSFTCSYISEPNYDYKEIKEWMLGFAKP